MPTLSFHWHCMNRSSYHGKIYRISIFCYFIFAVSNELKLCVYLRGLLSEYQHHVTSWIKQHYGVFVLSVKFNREKQFRLVPIRT